jgi:hypothetical protein
VPERRGCRGTVTIRILVDGRRTRTARVRLNRRCELFFQTRRTPARLGRPQVTIRFNGNAHVLPRLAGPQRAKQALIVFGP